MTNSSSQQPWKFWIDVGGTFTDCIGISPDGELHNCKILSSGCIRGGVNTGSSTSMILDPGLKKYPDGFFLGWQLSLLRPNDRKMGGKTREMDTGLTIAAFDSGALVMARKLKVKPRKDMIYELQSPEPAPLIGIRSILELGLHDPIPPVQLRLGTTRGTNALLQRNGARVAFLTSQGFGDLLEIGRQNRPELFNLHIRKPGHLAECCLEIEERIAADGTVLSPLNMKQAQQQLQTVRDRGIESLAITFMHSYQFPEHEKQLQDMAHDMGFRQVAISSKVAPHQGMLARAQTTVLDAYLSPVLKTYLQSIAEQLPDSDLRVMSSAGGLLSVETFSGKDSLLSGPAGGVVACKQLGEQITWDRRSPERLSTIPRNPPKEQTGPQPIIGFDMGGTSTDVCRVQDDFEYRYEANFRNQDSATDVTVIAPMLRIETVAAGGGSLCTFDGQIMNVGPQSAGSDPGPACYGKNGPLTVTDMNVFLGRVRQANFSLPLDLDATRRELEKLQYEMAQHGQELTLQDIAEGYLQIANRIMAQAIRAISLERGYDTRDHALACYGGAGAQHACAMARELDIETVILHPLAGLLSAWGMGLADVRKFRERPLQQPLQNLNTDQLTSCFEVMETELRDELQHEGILPDNILSPQRSLELRYQGQDWTLSIQHPEDGNFQAAFEKQHHDYYGFTIPDRSVEVCNARIELQGRLPATEIPSFAKNESTTTSSASKAKCWFDGEWKLVPVYQRKDINADTTIQGPALLLEDNSTIVIEPGWQASLHPTGSILLQADPATTTNADKQKAQQQAASDDNANAIQLQLYHRVFTAIAEEMGITLQRTALSTNVKERLDFSCAIFTAQGHLVVNAPHIPVHLGAMEDCVKHAMKLFPDMKPGDCFISNDPFGGGSHLPDVTVITPVFSESDDSLLFFTASRAHHADIGGIRPGSMPPFAKSLAEEGVLIPCMKLVDGGVSKEQELEQLLQQAPYPSRAVQDNMADIRAQMAANQRGARQLLALVKTRGRDAVQAYMSHLQDTAATYTSKALLRFDPAVYEFSDTMDDDSIIHVAITIAHTGDKATAHFDFSKSADVVDGNLNANPSIVKSAVLYCLRCMMPGDIPLNSGMLQDIKITLREGSLLHPPVGKDAEHCAAVGGGNVETAQRIVDVIFGALQMVAASQGTMNNILFGTDDADDADNTDAADKASAAFGYYETLAGGSGAGPTFDGADAVHTHMTNTRLTDPEVLESRYPVRLKQFSIRRHSGGTGKFKGGNGLTREIEFLQAMQLSLLTSRRNTQPYGMSGGTPGQPGINTLIRTNAETGNLSWAADTKVQPGDILRIETPGAGGLGRKSP